MRMSIYSVRAKTWWVVHRDLPKDMKEDIKSEQGILKSLLKDGILKCNRCKKIIKDWNKCFISHAYLYGFDDCYCDEKCLLER